MSISQVSTPTAARDLIDLENRGLLIKQGKGRSVRYYPAIDGWAEELPHDKAQDVEVPASQMESPKH